MSNNILKLLKSASVKGPLIIFNKLISKALFQRQTGKMATAVAA